MNLYLRLIIQFVVFVLFQVLVLNNIRLGGYMNPYLYVLFIIMLPFQIPGWLLLIVAFFLGYTIDIFTGTPGMHAAATVFMAFSRPALLKLLLPKQEYEPETYPSIPEMGFQAFFTFALMMVLIHHITLFLLEVFRFAEFGLTLMRAGLSTIFTLTLIILTQYLFFTKR